MIKRITATAVIILPALLIALSLLPQSRAGMAAQANPALTYARARRRFQEVEARERDSVKVSGRSRLLGHDGRTRRVYVLVHGATNSPLQWLELGQILFARGHNVLILRMPYHGLRSGQVGELKPLRAKDLRRYADEAVDIAAGLGEEIVVVGVSGGSAVAAWLAVNRPEVNRTLLLAPFFGIWRVPLHLGRPLMNLFSRLPNLNVAAPSAPSRDWVYPGQSSRGVGAFLVMSDEVQRAARSGQVPQGEIVVVTTAVDHIASNRVTANLVRAWTQAGAQLTMFHFGPEQRIPHNPVDPGAEAAHRETVLDELLRLLGEDANRECAKRVRDAR